MSSELSLVEAYLIGVFDGEGSIGVTKRRTSRGWALAVSVTMGAPVVVEMFTRWGGTVAPVKVVPGRLALTRWQVNGRHSMSKYTNESRRGVSVTKGDPYISEEDWARRMEIGREIRALNGARSRFAGRYEIS